MLPRESLIASYSASELERFISECKAALANLSPSESSVTFQHDLGSAYRRLGQIKGSAPLFKQAASAYRAALNQQNAADMPFDWGLTQTGLGDALRQLGDIEGNTSALEEAVEAYRIALNFYNEEQVPFRSAMTLNTLALALRSLGELRKDKALVAEARDAVLQALKVDPDQENYKITLQDIDRTLAELKSVL